jgi:hypothetical protein
VELLLRLVLQQRRVLRRLVLQRLLRRRVLLWRWVPLRLVLQLLVPLQLVLRLLVPRQLVPPQLLLESHPQLFDQFVPFGQLFAHHHLQKDPLILQH